MDLDGAIELGCVKFVQVDRLPQIDVAQRDPGDDVPAFAGMNDLVGNDVASLAATGCARIAVACRSGLLSLDSSDDVHVAVFLRVDHHPPVIADLPSKAGTRLGLSELALYPC